MTPAPADFTSIIFAHAAARDTVLRHLPFWQATSARQIFVNPRDAALALPGFEEHLIGRAEHHGRESNRRTRHALALIRDCATPWAVLHEYDSIALAIPEAALPPPGGFAGTVLPNEHPHRWTGKFFVHYPHIVTPAAAGALLAAMEQMPPDAEQGMSDRYIGLAAEIAGVPVHDFGARGLSFTRNTIKPDHLADAETAARNGALFWHGIKTETCLARILAAAGVPR